MKVKGKKYQHEKSRETKTTGEGKEIFLKGWVGLISAQRLTPNHIILSYFIHIQG